MTSTLATRKQSEAIRRRMQEIRTELPYAVDDARERVKQLSDWKYHMSQHPLPIIVAAVAAGFVIIPKKRSRDTVVIRSESASTSDLPAQRGMLGGIAGAVMTLLMRQAVSLAVSQVTNKFSATSQVRS